MSAVDSTFKAAIPGMSLTHKMGDLPHEKPPKFTDKNEALEHIWKLLNQPDILRQIWGVARQGGTAWAIARAILAKAAMSGIIQLNLAIVIGPIVASMIVAICKSNKIDVKITPKFRDKIFDGNKQQQINDKLSRPHNPNIPKSALRTQQYPRAADITKGHNELMKQGSRTTPQEPPQGLMAMAGNT